MIRTDRPQAILQELATARQTIAKSDAVDINGTRTLTHPQDSYLEGEMSATRLRAVSKQGDSIVVLTSEVLKKNHTGVQVAAAAIGGVAGFLLSGGRKTGVAAGAALGAWVGGGGEKTQAIERIQIDAQGVTTERVNLGADGRPIGNGVTYSQQWHRTAAPPPVDPQAVKDYIDKLDLGGGPGQEAGSPR